MALVAGAAGFVVLHGQQRKPSLTPQDYVEIQQLVARYAYALDGGLEHGKALADLFTDDGEFHHRRVVNKTEEWHFIGNEIERIDEIIQRGNDPEQIFLRNVPVFAAEIRAN